MKPAFSVLPLLCLLTLTACTSTRNLSDVRSSNGLRPLGDGTILMATGRTYFGDRIVARADSTTWGANGPGRWVAFPNADILSVSVSSRSRGALRGMRNGALIGAVSVVALTAMMGGIQPAPDGVGVVMPALGGGFMGIWIGGGVGLAFGHTTVTQFR